MRRDEESLAHTQTIKFMKMNEEIEVEIPVSTDECVIVPANPSKSGFFRNQFWINKPYIWGVI